MLKIGLLVCDHIREELRSKHGGYRQMFQRAFAPFSEQIELHALVSVDDEIPESHEEFDGYLITGSKYSVYEPLPWIEKLLILIRQCNDQQIPVVGICFGLQAIVLAMGGLVEETDKGWGIGLSFNQVVHQQPWMQPWNPSLDLIVSHKDHIITPPKSTAVLASSGFCPYYMIQIGDTLLGLQGHPEFSKEFSQDLMEVRRESIPSNRIREAQISLNGDPNSEQMVQWIVNFFCQF